MGTKTFPLGTLLTVTTGRLLTKGKGPDDNGIGDLYALLNWMTDDNLFTYQLGRASKDCKPFLLEWFPELAKVTAEQVDWAIADFTNTEKAIQHWLDDLIASKVCQAEYQVPKLPAGSYENKDALEELVEMRGGNQGIIVAKVK